MLKLVSFSAKNIAKRAARATATLDSSMKDCIAALESVDPKAMDDLRALESRKGGLVAEKLDDIETTEDKYFLALKTYYEKTRTGQLKTFGGRTQLALLMENVMEYEKKLRLTEPWRVGSTQWRKFEKRQAMVALKKFANKLQTLTHSGKTRSLASFGYFKY